MDPKEYFKNSNLDMSLNWLFDEFLDFFNIDEKIVKKIDHKGLELINLNKSKIIFLRFENLNNNIASFFEGTTLLKLNSSSHKSYSNERKKIKIYDILSKQKYLKIKESKFCKLYYPKN